MDLLRLSLETVLSVFRASTPAHTIDHLRPSIQALFLVFIHFRSTQHNFHPSYLCRNTHAHTFSVRLFIYCPCLPSLNCLVPPLVTCLAGFQAHPTCGSLNSQNHSQHITQTNHINIYLYTYIDPKWIYKKKKRSSSPKNQRSSTEWLFIKKNAWIFRQQNIYPSV